MKFIILTLFKEMYDSFLNSSIIARAIAKGLIEVKLVNIRDYTKDKYHRVDTPPIGGGSGLIMKCQPIVDALKSNSTNKTLKILLSPKGKTYNSFAFGVGTKINIPKTMFVIGIEYVMSGFTPEEGFEKDSRPTLRNDFINININYIIKRSGI